MAKTTFDDIKRALWAGANTFRDNIDAANYKDYVLSMFFVKYLSDTYAESVDDLKEKYEGIRLERQIEKFVEEQESVEQNIKLQSQIFQEKSNGLENYEMQSIEVDKVQQITVEVTMDD